MRLLQHTSIQTSRFDTDLLAALGCTQYQISDRICGIFLFHVPLLSISIKLSVEVLMEV